MALTMLMRRLGHIDEMTERERNAARDGDDAALERWANLHGWRLIVFSRTLYRLVHKDREIERYIDFLGDELLAREMRLCGEHTERIRRRQPAP